MGHVQMRNDAPSGPKAVQAGPNAVQAAGHGDVLGHGKEQRSGIDVARPYDRLHLQRGSTRMGTVHQNAVVHDSFEHRESAHDHTGRFAEVAPIANPDEDRLAGYALALADGIEAALPGWVSRCVELVADAWRPGLGAELAADARVAGNAATTEIGPRVRALLLTDVDAQRSGPLAVLRQAVAFPTKVLADASVGPVARDDFAERAFPADVYDLSPASFADIDGALHEPGLIWGAAKAHVVLSRRRSRVQP